MSDPAAPPPAAPRRGRPGRDQATVLRHAIALFNEQGYDATSMGDLASVLGFSKAAIYHHVPGKEHLLSLALDEALDELSAAVAVATRTDTGGSAYDRLRALVRTSVTVLVAHQPAVTLLLRVRGNSPVEQVALARRRHLDEQIAGLVQAAVDEGALRADLSPRLVTRLLFGMVNSLVEWHRPDAGHDVEVLATTVTELAFAGLDRPGDPTGPDNPSG